MTSMPGSNPNHGNLDNSDSNLPPPPAAFSPSSSHSQFLTVNIPCTRLVHHADNRSSPSPSKPAHKPLPSQSAPSHDPPPLVASGSSSSAPLSRPPAATATTATQRDYARRTSHIDDSLSSIVCYPYSTSSSIDSHRATGQFGRRSDAVHYMLRVVALAEFATVGSFWPWSSPFWKETGKKARRYNGVPEPSWGAESLVMLANDAGQCSVASVVEAGSLVIRTKMSSKPALSDTLAEAARGEDSNPFGVDDHKVLNILFHHRNFELDRALEEHRSDVAFLVAAKKMFVSAAQKRIYERFKEAEFKFTYLWWLFIILGFCIASDENWSWYYNTLDGGFVGGFGSSRGLNNDLAGLVPCASMSTSLAQLPAEDGPGHNWWPETFENYHGTCMDTEVELWDKYMAPATFMTCGKHEDGAKDFFHPLFLSPSDLPKQCNKRVPSTMEDALKFDGPMKYWDVAIRTDMGGVRGAMVEYPMVIHRALGGQPRTGFAKEVEKDDTVTQQALNNYRSCSVSPEMLGADQAVYANVSYLKRKDEGPCPEDPTQELVQNVLSEYDRLGSDSVNQYVRETVLGKWKDEKSNFTVLDVGCGIGGTMYSLAAKGHLNPHVASFKAEKANPKAWAKAWRGASTKSQGNLHYVGVALSSAEVVMAKKEASKRNLNPPFVDFVQQSFDDPELPVSGADAVVAIDSFGYSSNLDKTLKNVASKMKSGTTVVVVDYIRTKPYHDHNVYLAEGKWSFQRYLQSAYNPNNVNKKRQVKRKNFMSIHHPNFDRSQCLREAEGHDRARHFYTLDAWLSAFRSADLWVSDMSDIGTEHGGSSSPPLQGGDKAELRLGAFGFFGSSRQTMVIFWTLFTRFKNMLGYVFGMRPYIRDELEVYLGKVGWLIHSNLKDPDFPEEHTDEEVWTGRDAAMRFATVRLNQLLVDGYHLHLYRELEDCAFENGDIALYGFVLTKK